MSEQLNFSGLLPKIDSFSFPPATTDDLSASFVFLLLFIPNQLEDEGLRI